MRQKADKLDLRVCKIVEIILTGTQFLESIFAAVLGLIAHCMGLSDPSGKRLLTSRRQKELVSSAHTGFTSFTSTHVNMPQQQLSTSRRVQIFVLKKLLGFKFPISNMTQQFRIKHNITMGICGQFYHYKIFLGYINLYFH